MASCRAFVFGLAFLVLCAEPNQAAAPPARRSRVETPLPAGALYRLGSLRLRHQGRIEGLAISPDGQTVASLGRGSELRLWDRSTGDLIWQVRYPRGIAGFVFVAEGRQIAAFVEDGIELLASASGERVRHFRVPAAVRELLCSSPDGKTMAFGASGGIHLWDVAAGRVTTVLPGYGEIVADVVLFPDGKLLASASADGEVRVWDVATRKTVKRLVPAWPKEKPRREGDRHPQAIAVSHDGQRLAAGYWDGSVCIWSTRTWAQGHFKKVSSHGIGGMAFSSRGPLAWAGAEVGVFDVERGKVIWQSEKATTKVSFTPDGRTLVSGGYDGLIRTWDATTGKERPAEPGHPRGAHALAFSPGGDAIASLGGDGHVRLWGLAKRQQLHSWKRFLTFSWDCDSLGFSALSGAVVFGSAKTLTFGNPREGGEQASLALPDKPSAFACSADGGTLVVRIREEPGLGRLHVYDARTSKCLWEFQEPPPNLGKVFVPFPHECALTISNDGCLLASAYLNHSIQLWDLRAKKRLGSPGEHNAPVQGLTFSPDNRFLVSTGGGSKRSRFGSERIKDPVRVWNVGRMKQAGEFPCDGSAASVAYSPAGDLLASVSHGGALQVWETASGAELLRLEDERPNKAHAARFSPDGSILASAMADGTVLVWGLRPLRWSAPREPLSDRELGRLWEQLSGKAPEAYQAALTLSADKGAVAFLGKRLRRVEPETEKKIQQLIDALDSDDFDKRQAASAALAKLGGQAEAALRKEEANPRSQETRKRLQPLLLALDSCFETDPATLRDVRAIGVLRRIATAEAKAILLEVAKGAPEAAQTRAAKMALPALDKAPR